MCIHQILTVLKMIQSAQAMEPTQTLVINRLILSPPFHPNLVPYSCRKKNTLFLY